MQVAAAADSKNILVMGGTRFIGLFMARQLIKEGHQVSSTDTFLPSDGFL
jgi:nucleoside-diphosphate-sugar epimerase